MVSEQVLCTINNIRDILYTLHSPMYMYYTHIVYTGYGSMYICYIHSVHIQTTKTDYYVDVTIRKFLTVLDIMFILRVHKATDTYLAKSSTTLKHLSPSSKYTTKKYETSTFDKDRTYQYGYRKFNRWLILKKTQTEVRFQNQVP